MTAGLAGRVAVVTGTAHGVGAGIADALGSAGAKVHRVGKARRASENSVRQNSALNR